MLASAAPAFKKVTTPLAPVAVTTAPPATKGPYAAGSCCDVADPGYLSKSTSCQVKTMTIKGVTHHYQTMSHRTTWTLGGERMPSTRFYCARVDHNPLRPSAHDACRCCDCDGAVPHTTAPTPAPTPTPTCSTVQPQQKMVEGEPNGVYINGPFGGGKFPVLESDTTSLVPGKSVLDISGQQFTFSRVAGTVMAEMDGVRRVRWMYFTKQFPEQRWPKAQALGANDQAGAVTRWCARAVMPPTPRPTPAPMMTTSAPTAPAKPIAPQGACFAAQSLDMAFSSRDGQFRRSFEGDSFPAYADELANLVPGVSKLHVGFRVYGFSRIGGPVTFHPGNARVIRLVYITKSFASQPWPKVNAGESVCDWAYRYPTTPPKKTTEAPTQPVLPQKLF